MLSLIHILMCIRDRRYDVGQEFNAHTDYFDPQGADWETYCAIPGQRTWTLTVSYTHLDVYKRQHQPFHFQPIAQSSESTVVAEFVPETSSVRDAGYQSEDALEKALIAQLQAQAYEYLALSLIHI